VSFETGFRRALLSAGIAASVALGTSLAIAEEVEVPITPEISCSGRVVFPGHATQCGTRRVGVLTGGYFALEVGFSSLRPPVADRIGADTGTAVRMRIGFELWDHVVLGAGFGFLDFGDLHPTSEQVVDCVRDQRGNETCDATPHSESSSITGAVAVLEAGYQYRFRPSRSTSLVPVLYAGYQFSKPLERGVGCQGCPSTSLDASARGAYLAPFLRVTFLNIFAVFVRSDWYVTGDLVQQSSLGFEIGLP
jgi:hypothetical protein